jgi:hypothetical protein
LQPGKPYEYPKYPTNHNHLQRKEKHIPWKSL